VVGVLLDTVSIQRYIFSTNNLKENIGASFIVENIYKEHLEKVIREIFPSVSPDYYNGWEREPERIVIKEGLTPVEVGYIGGGNALLFFNEKDKAEEFIMKWTLRLIIYAPGLVPACAMSEIDFSNFEDSLKEIHSKLALNKSKFVPEVIIRRHGITAECPRTGYTRDVFCDKLPEGKKDYISSVSNAKIVSSDSAKNELKKILEECELFNKYTFTNEIDKLGQIKGEEGHIAIVHIDGNDMGQRFKEQKDLKSLRRLSASVRNATREVFKSMLKEIDRNIDGIKKELKLQTENEEAGKTILPLRPIIIGGDDITFVSEGRLGIWLAKIFLETFEKQKVSDNKPLSACAGVAITKTKYPFYKGYQLSEELTRSAKDGRKKSMDNGSWIDFHIAYGGFSGNIEELRRTHYKTSDVDKMTLRPYKISDLDEIIMGVKFLKEEENGKLKFPRSKLMNIVKVLYMGKDAQDLFMEEIKTRGLKLPEYKNFNGTEIVVKKETPYLDMIELMDFYPEFALKGGNK